MSTRSRYPAIALRNCVAGAPLPFARPVMVRSSRLSRSWILRACSSFRSRSRTSTASATSCLAWSAICEVGLQAQVHQRADTLSGGEQQRVAVARALAQQPSIILADEPVSSLDPAWAEDVLELIGQVRQHHGATLVMSLHQPELASRFARRIIGLRAGRVVFDGPPAALSDAHLEELYRGDDIIRIDDAAARARKA